LPTKSAEREIYEHALQMLGEGPSDDDNGVFDATRDLIDPALLPAGDPSGAA
jgi:hypothetical protein